MTAPNPVLDANRPATAEAVAGRETASHLTTTSAGTTTAYQPGDWQAWDEVTVSVNPALPSELAGSWCDWCAEPGHEPVLRVDCDAWWASKEVCDCCSHAVIVHAANYSRRVLVETAS